MLHTTLKYYLLWHARKVRESMRLPLETQRATFARLHARLGKSGFAVETGFDRCETLEDCRRLPISDGESMRPLFDRVFRGGAEERRIFGKSRLLGFARTSGTHGKNKDVPLNGAYLAALDRTLLRMMASHFAATGAWESLLAGKQLLLGSRPLIGESPTGLPVSDISGLIPTRTWPSLRKRLYLPHHSDLWIPDWPTKIERIIDQAHGQDLRAISGLPALADDFARRVKAKYGVTHLEELWPNLRMYIYGGGAFTEDQRAEMRRQWFGSNRPLSVVETYFATEGQLAYSYEPDQPGIALNTLENIYHFHSRPREGRALFAHEIEEGETYSLHVTTPGGLINYEMGDRIEVVTKRPLRIRFVGREKDEISMTGEKLTLAQLDLAWEAANSGTVSGGAGRPIVWVERAERPHLVWGALDTGIAEDGLAARLDEALGRFNGLYAEALFQEKVLEPSRVVPLPKSILDDYRSANLGTGQPKIKRLFNSRAEFVAAYGWSPAGKSHLRE